MIVEHAKIDINDDNGFNISSSSNIDVNINNIIKCGVSVKDFITNDDGVYYIPVNENEMRSKFKFLKNMGFEIIDNKIKKV